MPDAFIFGQDTERLVGLTGWIGTHPDTGADIAHLLVYPQGSDIGQKMRSLAALYQLAPMSAGTMPEISPEVAHATIDAEPVVRIQPGAGTLHRAVTGDWAVAARAQGAIVLTVGERALRYDHRRPLRSIDRYLADPSGKYTGLLSVMTI